MGRSEFSLDFQVRERLRIGGYKDENGELCGKIPPPTLRPLPGHVIVFNLLGGGDVGEFRTNVAAVAGSCDCGSTGPPARAGVGYPTLSPCRPALPCFSPPPHFLFSSPSDLRPSLFKDNTRPSLHQNTIYADPQKLGLCSPQSSPLAPHKVPSPLWSYKDHFFVRTTPSLLRRRAASRRQQCSLVPFTFLFSSLLPVVPVLCV